MADGAWVDAAVNDALAGADDEGLAAGLGSGGRRGPGTASGTRSAPSPQQLAAATHTLDSVGRLSAAMTRRRPVWTIENLLPDVVMPLAKKAPVLLLVMDGMSAATATEIVDDAIARHGWFEAALPGTDERRAGGGGRRSAHPHQREPGVPAGGAPDDRRAGRRSAGTTTA